MRLSLMLAASLLCGVALALFVLARQNSGADTAFGQPRVERRTQLRGPRSPDAIWDTLGATNVRLDPPKAPYVSSFPSTVSALNGETLTVAGFMLPLGASGATHHFLLSKYSPVCFFCPPGQPNESIEVNSTSAFVPTQDLVTITGHFALQKCSADGMFYRLDNADLAS